MVITYFSDVGGTLASMIMKVLFLRSNPIDPYPRCEKAMNALAELGISVRAIGWDREGRASITTPPPNVEWISIPCAYGKGFKSIYSHILWQLALIGRLLRERSTYTHIHAFDLDTIFPALAMKFFFQKQVVYDIADRYADRFLIAIIKHFFWFLDRCALVASDVVIVSSEAAWERANRIVPGKAILIYNTPPLITAFMPASHNSSFSLAFIGTLSKGKFLLEMADIVKRHCRWRFDIGGYGNLENSLRDALQSIPNIFFHGRLSYEETLMLYVRSDVLFILCDPMIPQYQNAAPNKIFEAMMLGKPILVARGTGMDALVEKTGCGIVLDYYNSAEVEKALIYLKQHPDVRRIMGERGRAAYEREYSWRAMEERLHTIYRSTS